MLDGALEANEGGAAIARDVTEKKNEVGVCS
jgi:hypothetical protein